MVRYFRYFLIAVCAIQALLAVAFVLQLPFAVRLWPLSYTNNMSFMFVGSIFAAAAAATLWCIVAKEDGALAGIGLDYLVILAPVSILAFQLATRAQSLTAFGIACALGAVFGLGLFLWGRRIPIQDPRPMPRLVRVSFVIFVIVLVVAGTLLVLKTPNVLPWNVTTDGQVIYGWMFIGAAAYFVYGLLRPSWHNSAGQLAGFLTYDLILIVPFLERLSTVTPARSASLVIYITAVSYSGLLAIFYLFINRRTRVWRREAAVPQPMVSPANAG